MRSFILGIDQRLHFSDLLVLVERYGQLAIFLLASGIIGYLYFLLQVSNCNIVSGSVLVRSRITAAEQ